LRSVLDGVPTSAESQRSAATPLIAIYGQHDALTLKNRSEVVRLLDTFGSVDTTELLAQRRELARLESLRVALGGDPERRRRDAEFLEFTIEEIEAAAITSGDELEEVLDELRSLTDIQSSQAQLRAVLDLLDGDDDHAVLTRLRVAIKALPVLSSLDAARIHFDDATTNLRDGVHALWAMVNDDLDGERFAWLESRVAQLQGLIRKYGPRLDDVLGRVDADREALARLRAEDEQAHSLEADYRAAVSRERELARLAKRDREYAAVRITEAVREQLTRVALPHASLRVAVDGDDGSDATILFTPNPGLPEGPLQNLASGGELSRVLLALSLVASSDDQVAVFDEVDAGVGGQVAQQIGRCLRELSDARQVVAITHLASVAAHAHHHFVIEKSVVSGVTTTTVREVVGDERVGEIARMLSGDAAAPDARRLAAQLLLDS
jgi:DNA repair protein RecN (Recombination protein N)